MALIPKDNILLCVDMGGWASYANPPLGTRHRNTEEIFAVGF